MWLSSITAGQRLHFPLRSSTISRWVSHMVCLSMPSSLLAELHYLLLGCFSHPWSPHTWQLYGIYSIVLFAGTFIFLPWSGSSMWRLTPLLVVSSGLLGQMAHGIHVLFLLFVNQCITYTYLCYCSLPGSRFNELVYLLCSYSTFWISLNCTKKKNFFELFSLQHSTISLYQSFHEVFAGTLLDSSGTRQSFQTCSEDGGQ